MRRSGCGRPSVARIGRLSQGPVSTAGGQVPSFSPPSTSRSARCRRASSGPQMASRGWRPKLGRTISGSSMVASRAGHSPPAMASLPVQAARRRASASASASPASPDHSASVEATVSAAAMVASSRASGAAPACMRAASPAVAASTRSISSCTASRSVRSPKRALSMRARIAARPGMGFSPRRHLRSSRRAASSTAARSPPSVHSGCFSRASRATGAKRSSTTPTSACSRPADGVSPSGVPAESSMSMFQRLSSAVTRRARLAVRRHQGGGLALFLQDPAQRQGNDQCLLMRRRAVGARHVLERGSAAGGPIPRWSRPGASAR